MGGASEALKSLTFAFLSPKLRSFPSLVHSGLRNHAFGFAGGIATDDFVTSQITSGLRNIPNYVSSVCAIGHSRTISQRLGLLPAIATEMGVPPMHNDDLRHQAAGNEDSVEAGSLGWLSHANSDESRVVCTTVRGRWRRAAASLVISVLLIGGTAVAWDIASQLANERVSVVWFGVRAILFIGAPLCCVGALLAIWLPKWFALFLIPASSILLLLPLAGELTHLWPPLLGFLWGLPCALVAGTSGVVIGRRTNCRQFSLRFIVLFLMALSIALAAFDNYWEKPARANAIHALQQAHARVSVSTSDSSSLPTPLQERYFGQIRGVDFSQARVEVAVKTLQQVRQAKQLDYATSLSFAGTTMDDTALCEVAAYTNLERLDLSDCPHITDAGLAHLHELRNLRVVHLWGTSATPSGVKSLQNALPSASIFYPL